MSRLGWSISWICPPVVSLATLRAALARAGVDEKMAGDMSPQRALRRALREMDKGRIIRQVRRIDDDHVTFQLTKEEITDLADYEREAMVNLNIKTGVVTGDVESITAEAEQRLQENLAKRVKADLTSLIHKLFHAHASDLIPLREEGGCYFVPSFHADLVARIRQMLFDIGGRLKKLSVQMGDEDSEADVAESVAEYLANLIKEYKDEVSHLKDDSKNEVFLRRLDKASELREKLSLLKMLLGGYADQIGAHLAEAESIVLHKLAATSAA